MNTLINWYQNNLNLIATIGFTVKRGTWASSNARAYQFNRRFLAEFLSNL